MNALFFIQFDQVMFNCTLWSNACLHHVHLFNLFKAFSIVQFDQIHWTIFIFSIAIWSNTSNWIMFIYSISSKHVQLFNLLVGAPVPDHYCLHSLIMVALRARCRYQHTFLETQSIAASLSADVIISQLIHLRPHHPHEFQFTMNAHKQDHLRMNVTPMSNHSFWINRSHR